MEDEKKKREEYKKRAKFCEKLGALKFQKAVFKLEEIKYKTLKKCIPNFTEKYEKYCDKRCKKHLKRAKTDQERKNIIRYYQNQKLLNRKEMLWEENRNYHMNQQRPTEFINYLNWNKLIHKRGLIKNVIVLPILAGLSQAGFGLAIPFLVLECISTFINFECINIQNYNINRFKAIEPSLKKKEERNLQRDIEQYGEAAKVISETIAQSKDDAHIPTFDEIIDNIQTKEQLEQLRNMISRARIKRAETEEKGNQKTIGSKPVR